MNNCVGIINLDENEKRMDELVRNRPLASVPIAAKYRIIDFVLSNMTNSGIECIGIFTKNKSRSLMDHLTNGRPWDLHRKKDGLKVFNFGDEEPFVNDVDNFYDNIDVAVKYGNRMLISDAGCAAILLHAAIESAIVNVKVTAYCPNTANGIANPIAAPTPSAVASIFKETAKTVAIIPPKIAFGG